MKTTFAIAIAGSLLIYQVLIIAALCAAIYIIGNMILKIEARFTYGVIALVFLIWLIAILSGWRL